MELTEYTSFNDIRAALGVSDDEIDDATLSLPLYSLNLASELDDVSPTLQSSFDAIREVAPADQTDNQKRLNRDVRLFATYAVAQHLTSSLPLFSPREFSDGKASFGRYQQNPYKDVIKAIDANYNKFKLKVIEVLALLNSEQTAAVAPRTFLIGVSSTRDPITGT